MASDFDKAQASWEEQNRQTVAKAKKQLYGLLRQARPTLAQIEVEYDGYGDSGQVQRITYLGKNDKEVKSPSAKLEKAVEEYALSLLPACWEDNCGAFGTVRIDVAKKKAHVEHNECYESHETSEWED